MKSMYWYTVFAVPSGSGDGWDVIGEPGTFSEIKTRLRLQGIEPRLIYEYRTESALKRALAPAELLLPWGWVFDERAGCCRAPGELFSEPPDPPRASVDIAVTADHPKNGWWLVRMTAGAQEHVIYCSNAMDPILSIIKWLEDIAAGRGGRVEIDEEGRDNVLSAWPRPDQHVRLMAWAERGDPEDTKNTLDLMVDARLLVGQWIRALDELVADEKSFRTDWVFHLQGHVTEPPFPLDELRRFAADRH